MNAQLTITAGQYSDRGRKQSNQDFHGLCQPKGDQLALKGIAVAVADGISSSDVSHIASQFAVTNFLEDYYCTAEAWSVKTSVERVLSATNSWLHAQTQQSQYRYDQDRGYVCTLSAMVFKSTTAHVFHVGDSRIYHVRGHALEQLTIDHRVSVSRDQSYLSRALGFHPRLEIDYQALAIEKNDHFVLATDGVHEYLDAAFMLDAIAASPDDLDRVATAIGGEAFRRGSTDNLTVQVIRVDALPNPAADEMQRLWSTLALPPILEARALFDGYRIVRELHGSSRSHVYLAQDIETDAVVVIKAPSIDLQDDPAYLERFLMEEWIARRIDSAHVLKARLPERPRRFLYTVMEFIDGQTLAQWMIDQPRPSLDAVRAIAAQIAKGLRAFHRLEMLHQDLRPENIMIDSTGTLKIVDFGATRVAGIQELDPTDRAALPGTPQYMAPEYFLGAEGTVRSDLFSLGVITYRMLTGELPYGTAVARATTGAAQRALQYRPIRRFNLDVPQWVDEAVRKAVHPNPLKRYADTAEFIFDLHQPNRTFAGNTRAPLIERDPAMFWKGISVFLLVVVVLLLSFTQVRR